MNTSLYHPKHWLSWLGIGIIRLMVLLPHRWLMKFSEALGTLAYNILPHRRHIAEVNIALCFPELSAQQQATMVRNVMINTIKGFFEMALSWWASDKVLQQLTHLDNLALLEKYQQEGRGVILLGMHYTTIELASATIGLRKKIDITYKEQKGDIVNELMHQSRKRHLAEQIEKQSMRTMIKNLRQGHVVWYAPDQDFGRNLSVFAPFFGIQAATISTLGKLARRTNAKVLMYAHFRHSTETGDTYHGKIIDPFPEAFGDDDVHNATIMNKAMEDVIRENPEQYNWLHQRFRTRPNREEPKMYPHKKQRSKPKTSKKA